MAPCRPTFRCAGGAAAASAPSFQESAPAALIGCLPWVDVLPLHTVPFLFPTRVATNAHSLKVLSEPKP
eukprot:scaffold101423_cov24-Tisochrysis_lutea.AAC.1